MKMTKEVKSPQPKYDKVSEEEITGATVWNTIPWKEIEKEVFKLQKKIYKASADSDVRKVRKLQKMLLNSYKAKLLAVRKVTQDNRGKKTSGVDGVKNLMENKDHLEYQRWLTEQCKR